MRDCINCDVNNHDSLVGLPDFDVVIHGVADSTIGPQLPGYAKIEKSIIATINIANFAKRANVRKIIYLSSGAVYGSALRPHESLSELTLNMASPVVYYALGKLSAERYLQSFCLEHDISLTILRAFTFGGPDLPRDTHYALGNFVQNVLDGEDISIKGDGKVLRSYMHQDDLCEVICMMINDDKSNIFNVGSDEPVSIKDLAERIIALSGKDLKLRILSEQRSHNDDYVPNIAKLLEEKNFKLNFTLDDIIQSMLDRHLKACPT